MRSGISDNICEKNPFLKFENWYKLHSVNYSGELNAMALSTSGKTQRVSSRIVLLKDYSESGFVFYTNYNSRKGIQLSENSFASLLFYWPEIKRQIRIEGSVEKIPGPVSDEYFRSRPRESQISAVASPQSKEIPDYKYLQKLVLLEREKYSGKEITRPAGWGGYILVPDWFEFWTEGEFRLHDRISYSLEKGIWTIKRLAP